MADRRRGSKGKPRRKAKQTRTVNKEKTKEMTLPRLDTVEKIPSNAPTMAIAPSDYEHIFHEVATGPVEHQSEKPRVTSPQPSPASPPQTPALPPPPPPPPPRTAPQQPEGTITQSSRRNEPDYGQRRENYLQDVQVTPDGYTLLGHNPDHMNQRRIALPPYIVRANNQFSRAALARIARYLQSRAER